MREVLELKTIDEREFQVFKEQGESYFILGKP